ncbi:MAG: hypothetical protein NT013_07185, partial [Planctomycetia bacterium]|nr:hypothetical protein [Planctomycetia bacterium]
DLHRQTDTIAARSSVLPTAPAHHPHHKNPTSRTPNLMAGYFLVVALGVTLSGVLSAADSAGRLEKSWANAGEPNDNKSTAAEAA